MKNVVQNRRFTTSAALALCVLPAVLTGSCGQSTQPGRSSEEESPGADSTAYDGMFNGGTAKLVRPGEPVITYKLSATAAGAAPLNQDFMNLQNPPPLTALGTWQLMCDADRPPVSMPPTDPAYANFCWTKMFTFNNNRRGAATWKVEKLNSNDNRCATLQINKFDSGDLNPDDMLLQVSLLKPVIKKGPFRKTSG